ncbi:uncharacterized calcium-binding protein B0563.7-like [Liolophura sinensis]|uniref:uncharacterized calcium-binding protein B0563.7-like n=1 Tax=Liolophura sinensis TaxID=3198878 RepID=UPI0031580A49
MGNRQSSYKVTKFARKTPLVVSDYRIKKFESYFNFLDTNNDGVIGKEDHELAAKNMTALSSGNVADAESLIATLMTWWGVQGTEDEEDAEITVAEAGQRIATYCRRTDPEIAEKQTRSTYDRTFDFIDWNKDGVISQEELMNYYKSYGVFDEDFITEVFEMIDVSGNGVISREDFVDAHVAFWYNDDPKNGFHVLYDVPKGLLL